jgi:hypothetical protein
MRSQPLSATALPANPESANARRENVVMGIPAFCLIVPALAAGVNETVANERVKVMSQLSV